MCRQVQVSAAGLSLVQKSPEDCGVSECDLVSVDNEEALANYGLLRHGGGEGE